MTIAIVVLAVAAAVIAAAAVAVARRSDTAESLARADIQRLQSDLDRLLGRVEEGFAGASRDATTVRSALDLLTHDSGRRGTWGEVTLRRLLERSGLDHGIDFATQVSLDGGRPDAVVDLGSGGSIVIDAKAPLDDLRRAWEAEDDEVRDRHLKAHAAAVRRHARELAARGYPGLLRTTFAPVVMYLPVEGAWEEAAERLPALAPEVLSLGVHPASPRTLGLVLELLKHHALTANQEEAAREVVEEARQLLVRMENHAGHLAKLGRSLETTVKAYNEAVGNAASRVFPSAGRIAAQLGRQPVTAPDAVEGTPRTERLDGLLAERVA